MGLVNIPNSITFIRVILGLFAIYYLLVLNVYLSAIFLLVFYLLDFFDGFLARKLNQQTKFGAYFDTVVDGGVPLIYVLLLVFVDVIPLAWYFVGLFAMIIRGLVGLYLIKRNRHTSLSYNIKRVTEAIFVGGLLLILFGLNYEWFIPLPFVVYLFGALLSLVYIKK